MAVFDTIQGALDRFITPISVKMSNNAVVQALSGGMMSVMPVTLGVSLMAVVINFTVGGWKDILMSSGLYTVGNEVLAVTLSLLALYLSFTIATRYGVSIGLNGTNSAVVTLGIMLVLMPITLDGETYKYFINTSYLGSNGIFMALVLGIAVPAILQALMKRFTFKLPDTVPPMVSESLAPTFATIIMFTAAFLIKWGFTFTPWGNVFDMVNTFISAPIMNVGTSPFAVLIVYTLASLVWFFGVHPSVITNVYAPVMLAVMAANTEAALAGNPLPYLTVFVMRLQMALGGTGEGIGVALSLLFTKSERYKAMRKIAVAPALFNISEPLMFGLPVVLNPVYLVPCLLATPVCGCVAWVLCQFGLGAGLNPSILMPWIMPAPVSAFFMGGIGLAIISLICCIVATLVFFPFVKAADNMALAEEAQKRAAEEA